MNPHSARRLYRLTKTCGEAGVPTVAVNSDSAGFGNADDGKEWTEIEALELWKYFGGVGAADKNTMVTVQSVLLPIQAALVGYVAANLLDFQNRTIVDDRKALAASVLGFVIAVVAGYVSLLYGGYSNRNWAQADAIAETLAERRSKWSSLLPRNSGAIADTTPNTSPFAGLAWRLGRPCDPIAQLAPIFAVFAGLALGAGVFHMSVFVLSIFK
jgi:hypothetical protein